MQESAIRRMAAVEVIRHSIRNLTSLVDKQFELAGSEIKEGLGNLAKGTGLVLLGIGGLALMMMALGSAAVLAIALLSARIAFFLMAKSYQSITALEGLLQGSRDEVSTERPPDAREVA